jgi:hypothetical protein
MKRIGVALILFGLFSIPSYSGAEILAPTGVAATEGTYRNVIIITWNFVPTATGYEIWRDDYNWCEGPYPCEPKLILWSSASYRTNGGKMECIDDYPPVLNDVIEYRIRAYNDNATSDFSLPAYGFTSEEGTTYNYPIPEYRNYDWGSAGGGGIFGDIIKSSVIGYHFDGFTIQSVQVFMPVTPGFKALKGAQEYVRSFAPNLAVMIREGFDYLEQQADADKEGILYNIGTYIFPILGELAEKTLKEIGEEKFIDEAYSDTTISVEEFKKLERRGQAIAFKVVKNIEISKQEKSLTELLY